MVIVSLLYAISAYKRFSSTFIYQWKTYIYFLLFITEKELYLRPFTINDGFEAEIASFSSALCITERAVIFYPLGTLDIISKLW